MIKYLPIRYALPIFLLLLGVFLTCLLIAEDVNLSNTRIENDARLALESLGERSASQVAYYITKHDVELVIRENALLSKIPHLRSSSVFDEANQFLASTLVKPKGPIDLALIMLSHKTRFSQIKISDDGHLLIGAFPFQYNRGKLGALYIEMDLHQSMQAQVSDNLRRAILFCLLSLLLVASAWIFLDRTLSQRVNSLIGTVREMAAGNLQKRSSLKGLDEMAELGSVFNNMANSIQSQTEKLKISESNFRRIIETANEGIFEIDCHHRITLVNESLAQMLGDDPKLMPGKLIQEYFFTPEITEHANRFKHRHFNDKFYYECRFRRLDGSELWTLVSVSANWDEAGAFAGALGMVSDHTQRKRIQDQLRLHSAALNASACAVLITNSEGIIEWVNPACSSMTGYSFEELLGQRPSLFHSGKQDSRFYQQMWTTIKGGKIWSGEVINKRKGGDCFRERITISPVLGDQGQILHFVSVMEDVSVRHRLEQQVREAAKMEAISRLAGGVAHDFNNMLTVIIGYAGMLRKSSGLSLANLEMVSNVDKSAQRAIQFARQLQVFGRRSTLQTIILDLNQTLRHLFNILKNILGKTINLRTQLATDLPKIKADPNLIDQVIITLATNAKNNLLKGGNLSISTEIVAFDNSDTEADNDIRAGRFVCLTMADNGPGMDTELLTRLFEPFQKEGLALATVYSVIKQHDGWVKVYSRVNTGSTFKVYLPICLELSQFEVVSVPVIPNPQPHEEATILLVEDDDLVSNFVSACLRRSGYKVLMANSSDSALELWRKFFPAIDLLLTDIIIPSAMNGRELGEVFREQKPQLKIIYSSGNSLENTGITKEQISQGFFLAKPYDPEKLMDTVHRVLAN